MLTLILLINYTDYSKKEDRNIVLSTATQSIQQEVNSSQSGSIIIVKSGTYLERVRVSKNDIKIICEAVGTCFTQGFEVWGSDNVVDGFVVTGLGVGIDVRQHDNVIRNIEVHDITIRLGDADGIHIFGTGHLFENIYIHDIDEYDNGDPHTDCFQTWAVPERGGAASFITIKNVVCDLPFGGGSKTFQSSGGSHDWTIRNVVSITPMAALFYDAYNINVAYSTFIGAETAVQSKPNGFKFLTSTGGNEIAYSIFTNITGTAAIYLSKATANSHNNCYWQTKTRIPDPGDVYADPLLLPDFSLALESPCAGMGAFPILQPVTPTITPTQTSVITPTMTITNTSTTTPTLTSTLTPTITKTFTPTFTPTPTFTQTQTPAPTLDYLVNETPFFCLRPCEFIFP